MSFEIYNDSVLESHWPSACVLHGDRKVQPLSVSWCTRQRTKNSCRTYSHHMVFADANDRTGQKIYSPRTRCPLLPDLVDSANSKLSPPVHCAHVGRTADFQPFPTHLTSLLQYLLATRILFGTKAMKAFRCCFGPIVLIDEPSKTIWLWHFTSQLPRCAELSHSGNRSCRPSLSQELSSADRPARTARWFALQL